MFTIISIMFIGIGIGYLMRNVQMLQKVEKSASLTILLLLFVLGVSIGSNRLIVDNLGRFGWQAAVLASLSITGSMPPESSQIVNNQTVGDRKSVV